MRILYRLVVVGALAAAIGSSGGLLFDGSTSIVAEDAPQAIEPAIKQMVDESADRPASAESTFKSREVRCLSEIIYREARSETVGIRQLMAMVVLARRDDPDSQWPKTICGILAQPNQISQSDQVIRVSQRDMPSLASTFDIAADIYDRAWQTQLLPQGWECVRYWKISDVKLAKLSEKNFEQLGISKERKGLGFFNKLEPVETPPGSITFYRDPNRCGKKLPTT